MKKMNLILCICVILSMMFSMTAFALVEAEISAFEDVTATEEVKEAVAQEATEETAQDAEEATEEVVEPAEETKDAEKPAEETAKEAEDAQEPAGEVAEEATEETEEAAEEAVEEVEEVKNYDDEAAFDRLRGYEIMQGDENGNLNLEDDVTRAEMAQFIINAKHMKGVKYDIPAGEELFTDVADDADVSKRHWAFNTIYLAKSLGVINGHGDGTFEPEGKVTYEQAVKMIVNLLGYGPKAESKGGYPNGHIMVASEIGLTKYVKFDQTANAIRKDIAIMLDTALDIPVMEQIGYGSEPEYKIFDGENGTELVTLENEFIPEEESDEAEEVVETEEKAEEVAETEEEATEDPVAEETTEEATEEPVAEETTEEPAEDAAEEAVEETEKTEE